MEHEELLDILWAATQNEHDSFRMQTELLRRLNSMQAVVDAAKAYTVIYFEHGQQMSVPCEFCGASAHHTASIAVHTTDCELGDILAAALSALEEQE